MGGKVFSRVGAQRDFWVLMSDTASFSDRIHAQVNKANKKKNIGPAKTLSCLAGWPTARTRPNKINKFNGKQ